jgi:hypothetical protein
VSTKYPSPATAVKPDVLTVVVQEAEPVAPKFVAVPWLLIVAPFHYLHYRKNLIHQHLRHHHQYLWLHFCTCLLLLILALHLQYHLMSLQFLLDVYHLRHHLKNILKDHLDLVYLLLD